MNNLFAPQQVQLNEMVFISSPNKKLLANAQDVELDRIFDEVAREIALACEFIANVQGQ